MKLDRRDGFMLNVFWLYGCGMMTKKEFMQMVDILKYDITKEDLKKTFSENKQGLKGERCR